MVLLFCFSFFFSFLLLQGIPFFMSGEDDMYMGWVAMRTSWNALLRSIFFERLSLIVEGGNFYGNIAERGAYFLLFKILIAFDGMRFPDINYLLRMFLFSSTVVLIYLLLEEFQVHKALSVGGALLYATAMPVYASVHFIGDTTLYSHFFMLLCYYLFFARYLTQEKTNPIPISILIFLSGLFALKSKQSAVALPVILFMYCILVKQNVGGVMKRRIPLFSIALLYYLPSPFAVLGQQTAQRAIEQFNVLLNFRTYYLYNPWTNMAAGEQVPALFSPFSSYLTDAGSLLGIYKFFLGWSIIFFAISYLISSGTSLFTRKKIEGGHIFFFLVLWHMLEIGIMSVYFQRDVFHAVRYVGIVAPSFIVITLFCTQRGIEYIAEKAFCKGIKKMLVVMFILFLGLTLASNLYSTVIHERGGSLSRHILIHDSIVVIYKDYFQKANVDDTIFFRIFKFIDPNREDEEGLAQLFFTDLADQFGTLYNPQDMAPIQEKITEKGFAYIATYRSEILFTNKQLLAKLSACPSETSFYCSLKERIRGEARPFYVYKVSLDMASNPTDHQ